MFGALSGLIALSFSNIVTSFFKGGSIINSGPYSLSALMLASATLTLSTQYQPETILLIVFLIVAMSGLIQVIIGIVQSSVGIIRWFIG